MQGQSLTIAEANELRELKKIPTQRGGYGRPTWAPLNSGSSLMQALGVQPGSTAGNLLATATGSKTPQQIQQELVAVEQQIRAITTQQFQTNETYTEELNKFNGDAGTTGIRQDYLELVGQVSYWKFMEKLSSDKLRSFNGVPEPAAATTTNLQAEFDKDFKKTEEVGPAPKKEFNVWLKESIENVNKRKKKNFRGEKPPTTEGEYAKWYADLKTKAATGTATGSTTRMTETEYTAELKKEIDAAKKKEDFIFKESMKKSEYDESVAKLTELRSKRSGFTSKLKELTEKKQILLEELSAYKVPQSSWDKTKQPEARSTVPTGEELNKLLIEYKAKQEEIKQKQVQIDEELSLKLQPDGTLTDATTYNSLKGELTTLKDNLKIIIAKIEGRSTDQTNQVKALNELDIFIKQLKEQKVKAVTLFDNPDFRKVFDMLTLMSLDSDPKSFVVNMDKYSNFFVTTKGFSAYNGEVLDKTLYFLNNYDKLIKDARTLTIIGTFGMEFKTKNIENTSENIKNTKTFLENSGITSTEEFKKLDATQRRILEGRSTAWHTFFTDSDTLKAIPKAFSSVLFKTELDKLVKLESVIKRRILDKIDKTKFETVTTAPSVALTGSSWYTRYIPDVSAWFTSKPADRKQFLLAFCKKFKEENIQKIESIDKEFEKYEKLITEKATKGINGSLLTMSDAISELEKAIPSIEKERDRRLDPKLKRRIQADIDDFTQRKTRLETNLNSYKNERKSSMQLKEINKDLIAKLELLKDDENCLKNAERVLKDIRLLNRCDEIFQRVLAEQKDILKDLPKLEQYLRSALRQQGDFSPAETEDCIERKLKQYKAPPSPKCNAIVRNWLNRIGDPTKITVDEISWLTKKGVTNEELKRCVEFFNSKGENIVLPPEPWGAPSLPGLTPIVINVDSVTDTSITLSWTGADGAEFTLDGMKVTSPYIINGLTPNTDYTYKIIGTLGKDTVESTIAVKTDPAPVPVKDAGTDTNKLEVCLEKVGDLFLWNGNTYAVDSVIEKDVSIDCITKCTALLGMDKYTVELVNKIIIKFEKFEKVVPVLDHFVDLYTKLPRAGGTTLENWRVYDTLGDGNCLLHAFVQATSPTYKSLKTINEKLESVKITRSDLAKATKSDGTSYFRSDRIKTDGVWLYTEDLEDLLKFEQTQTRPNKLVALIFDERAAGTATLHNPLGLSLSLGSYKLNSIPDDTDIIFIHANGTHFSSISDATGNFIMKYSEAIKIPELKRALSPRLFPTMEFKKFTDIKEIVKSGGGIISSVKYEGRDYVFKDLRYHKSSSGKLEDNAGDWEKILEVIEKDPVYTNMKNDKNTHLISPLFLVLDDSDKKIGYTMKFLDKSYVTLSTILKRLLTEQQLKGIIKELMVAYKELQTAGTMACPEHANNIMISNFGTINQHTVIIDLDENVIKCKDNTEKDALDGLGLIFDGYNTPNVNLPDSFKWLFNLRENDKILKPEINTFDDLEKLASTAVPPAGKRNTYEDIRDVFLGYTKAEYDSSLETREKVERIGDPLYQASVTQNPSDGPKILDQYKLLTGKDLVPPKVEGPLKLDFPAGSPKPAGYFSDPDKWLRTLQAQVNIFNRAYNTNLVYTNDGLKTINEIIKILNGNGYPSSATQLDDTDFSSSLRNRLKEKLDRRIIEINLALGRLYDDPENKRRGGNHETRRHRVRGMPKRAKTRRMY